MLQVLSLYLGNRTCQVALLLNTITDDHHIVQCLGVLIQCDLNVVTAIHLHGLCGITDVTDNQCGIVVSLNTKVTIEICNGTSLGALNLYTSTNDWFASYILHRSFN